MKKSEKIAQTKNEIANEKKRAKQVKKREKTRLSIAKLKF